MITFEQARELSAHDLACRVEALSAERDRLREALHLAMLHFGRDDPTEAESRQEHLERIMELRGL